MRLELYRLLAVDDGYRGGERGRWSRDKEGGKDGQEELGEMSEDEWDLERGKKR